MLKNNQKKENVIVKPMSKKVYDVNVVSFEREKYNRFALISIISLVLFMFVFLNWFEFLDCFMNNEDFLRLLFSKLWDLLSISGFGFVIFFVNYIVFPRKKH